MSVCPSVMACDRTCQIRHVDILSPRRHRTSMVSRVDLTRNSGLVVPLLSTVPAIISLEGRSAWWGLLLMAEPEVLVTSDIVGGTKGGRVGSGGNGTPLHNYFGGKNLHFWWENLVGETDLWHEDECKRKGRRVAGVLAGPWKRRQNSVCTMPSFSSVHRWSERKKIRKRIRIDINIDVITSQIHWKSCLFIYVFVIPTHPC